MDKWLEGLLKNLSIISQASRGWGLTKIAQHQCMTEQEVLSILKPVNYSASVFKSPKTREIGRYIFIYMQESGGRAPTIREIGRAVGGVRSQEPMSPSNVFDHLRKLEKANIISTAGVGRSRSIRIMQSYYHVPELPESLKEQHGES